jgi:hypothetical protein
VYNIIRFLLFLWEKEKLWAIFGQKDDFFIMLRKVRWYWVLAIKGNISRKKDEKK